MPDAGLRICGPGDLAGLERLYPVAFPDEDLMPLVHALLGGSDGVLSLVALQGETIIGHAIFTPCSVAVVPVALVGPVAVRPEDQRKGHGQRLLARGLGDLVRRDVVQALVLGDPAYYGRFGFRTETEVLPPYPLPEAWRAAWQSRRLGDAPGGRGRLDVPDPWRDPALWS